MLTAVKDRVDRIIDVMRFTSKLFRYNRNRCKRVFLNLHNAQNGPYYFDLIKHFEAKGYAIYIKFNWHFLYARTDYFRSVLKAQNTLPYLTLKSRAEDIYCYDKASAVKQGVKNLYIEYNSFSPEVNYDIGFPFGISPVHYINKTLPDFTELRSKTKTMRILFSGNTNQVLYDHEIFDLHFKMVNRYRAIELIQERLVEKDVAINESNPHSTKLNLKIWEWEPAHSKNLDQRIPNEKWFETLASSDFFLGLPGYRMPLCYNLIEAMAVGCIPILEYAEFFYPPLDDGMNCIKYKGADNLIERIKEVNRMDSEKIQTMKNNVIAYYDRFHKQGKVIDRIKSIDSKVVTLKMYCEVQSIIKMKFHS